jgi:hypothetical protein
MFKTIFKTKPQKISNEITKSREALPSTNEYQLVFLSGSLLIGKRKPFDSEESKKNRDLAWSRFDLLEAKRDRFHELGLIKYPSVQGFIKLDKMKRELSEKRAIAGRKGAEATNSKLSAKKPTQLLLTSKLSAN